MNLSKPMKLGVSLLGLYVLFVLLLRFGRGSMDWSEALLFGLVMAPVGLLLLWGRSWLNGRAADAGRRFRERRETSRAAR